MALLTGYLRECRAFTLWPPATLGQPAAAPLRVRMHACARSAGTRVHVCVYARVEAPSAPCS